MIRLTEHQSKAILKNYGIRIPVGRLLQTPDAPKTETGGLFVLKAQIGVGSRFKKGLVAIGDRAVLLRKKTPLLRNVKQHGGCRSWLFEEFVPHRGELYIAVVSDPALKGPVMLFSRRGGIDVENIYAFSSRAGAVRMPIDILHGFDLKPFVAAVRKTGVVSSDIGPLARLASRLYAVYREWDCRFVEVNPLVAAEEGWTALDAKIELDEDARFRLEQRSRECGVDLDEISERPELEARAAKIDERDWRGSAHFVENDVRAARKRMGAKLRAVIGFNGVGTGASLTAMDELVGLGFYPRNFCDTSGNPPASKLYRATKIILAQPGIQGYFFISCVSSQQLDNTARGIIKAFKEVYAGSGGKPPMPSLFHFRGAWDEEARQLFRDHGLSDAPNVRIMGRESSERDAAEEFGRLYADAS